MEIQYLNNYKELSEKAAHWLAKQIQDNPNLKLGIATGNSPLEMYRNIAKRNDLDTSGVSIFQVDEWAGISEYSNTCKHYIEKEICKPWSINSKKCFLFTEHDTNFIQKSEVNKVVVAMQQNLEEKGPLDVLILGFGKNGHIGFIEPSDTWAPDNCFVSTLEKATQSHSMMASEKISTDMGVTMGLKSVREAKTVLFLITGDQKYESYQKWLTKELSPRIPASILWQHPNVLTLTDLKAK